jgi:hypothetical protein
MIGLERLGPVTETVFREENSAKIPPVEGVDTPPAVVVPEREAGATEFLAAAEGLSGATAAGVGEAGRLSDLDGVSAAGEGVSATFGAAAGAGATAGGRIELLMGSGEISLVGSFGTLFTVGGALKGSLKFPLKSSRKPSCVF